MLILRLHCFGVVESIWGRGCVGVQSLRVRRVGSWLTEYRNDCMWVRTLVSLI